MTLCHTHRITDPFVRLDKRCVMDPNLSLKAKGILAIAFSRPTDWKFYKKEMMKHFSDGETSFDSGVKELEEVGYLHRHTKHDTANGRFQGWEWHFFEVPIQQEEFKKSYRDGGFPLDGVSPSTGKPSPTKKEEETKKENNNPAMPVPAPTAVVVPSCLKSLPDITEHLMMKLADQWKDDLPRLSKACEFARSYKDPTSRAAILLSALKEGWVAPPKKEDIEKKNSDWKDEKLKKYDGKLFGPYTLNVCSKRVEFTAGGNTIAKVFEISDPSFISLVNKFIQDVKNRSS